MCVCVGTGRVGRVEGGGVAPLLHPAPACARQEAGGDPGGRRLGRVMPAVPGWDHGSRMVPGCRQAERRISRTLGLLGRVDRSEGRLGELGG